MAPLAFLNLLAISSIAILSTAFSASPASALSIEHNHIARSFHHPHAALSSKKKRSSGKCKPKSSSVAASTAVSTTQSSSSSANKPAQTPAPAANVASGPPAPSGGPGSKPGLSWANAEQQILPNIITHKIGWYYNWSPQKIDGNMAGLEFIPQYWGEKNNGDWLNTVVQGYATRAFFVNEPDQPGQSNMDASTAVQLWWQYMEPLKNRGYQLIGAAPTNSPAGTQWQAAFLAGCKGCTISAIAGHYYGTSGSDFINHFSGWHSQFNMDMYITEFACQDFSGANQQCNSGEISSFMGQVLGWMESQDYVVGYAPFGAMTPSEVEANQVNGENALIGDNLQLTALGEQYFNS